MLGLEQMHYYDIYPPLVSLDKTFDFETSNKITLDAMEILGSDWVEKQRDAMNQRWVHVYPQQGKFLKTIRRNDTGNYPLQL